MNIESSAQQVYRALCRGGLAVVPTTAGYGLVAMSAAGVQRIYALKGRPSTKPCVVVATWPIFGEVTTGVDPAERRWIAEVTRSAPLAVVARLAHPSRLLSSLDPFVRDQCTHAGTVATFHNAGAVVTRLAELAYADGRLIVGSSGNRSGSGNAYALDEVPARKDADIVIDAGDIPMQDGRRLATTILDLPSGRFVREGIGFEVISRSWWARSAPSDQEAAPAA